MKKLTAIFLCLAMLSSLVPVFAETEENQYQYDARTLRQIFLRSEPTKQSRQVKKVPKGKMVNIITYDEEWSLVEYGGKVGYADTQYLFYYHSHDPYKYAEPSYEKPYGIGTMKIEFNPKGMAGKTNNYGGNEIHVGDKLTVHYYDQERDVATILVWRSYIELPAGAMDVEPFVDYNDAQPGDLLTSYTSYTSMNYGAPYAANRRGNVARAVELVNGAVVKAGEKFSYNAYAAPYTKKNGYFYANIVGGEGRGYGGGACQISVLTYSAALSLPFRIVDHYLHTDEGSAYALWWCDAAVSNSRDLSFINLLPYDVRFELTWDEDGMANIFIYRAE